MAMSLEELLAKEGFRGRRSKMLPRVSSEKAVSMPLYPFPDQKNSGSSSVKRTARTRSSVSSLSGESPTGVTHRSSRLRNTFTRREKVDTVSKKKTREKVDIRSSEDLQGVRRMSIHSSGELTRNEIVEVGQGKEIVEVGVEENERYKDIHSNELYMAESSKGKYANGIGERERYKERSGKDIKEDKRYGNNPQKLLPGRTSFSDNYRRSMKQPETSNSTSNRSSLNSNSFDDSRRRRHAWTEHTVAEPALDEVAVQAMISILSGYIKRFIKDEDFRTLIHHTCFASLNFAELEEDLITESKVISNLEQAIGTVERAIEEGANAKELKKASLQLSVISGLNSNELKDGFTSGIPNYKLSACAHLYLSVIYKLQKKDRIAAKHLLQVFCDSPFQARTALLPELWDYIFFPHISHLKVWYNEEVDSLGDTPSKARKLMLLDKVYNEILDCGTYQFAVYYKDWLTEGVEAPSIPSIPTPSVSVQEVQQGCFSSHSAPGFQQRGLSSHSLDMSNPVGSFSPQPRVSKNLYDSVFGRSHKPGVDEVEDYKEAENFENSISSSDSSAVEDKQALTHSSEIVKYADDDTEPDYVFHLGDGVVAKKAQRLQRASGPDERNLDDKFENTHLLQTTTVNTHVLNALPHKQAHELALRRLAKSVFEKQQTEESVDLADSTLLLHPEDAYFPDSLANLNNRRSSIEELNENCEYLDEGPSFLSTPHDFICPLTGLLFEDPVTLETGQTFERVAITEWFGEGNRTCPVTGRTLECQAVPLTNFILKRVIDNWKSEHCRHFLDFASQAAWGSGEYRSKFNEETAVLMLEQLLTTFSKEERITNAENLLSLGGLQFLIKRFEFGNLEEKTRVATLLFCCIEVDTGCRNQIAKNIRKPCLLELLHSKQVKSRASAVLLLTELICLNRRKDVNLFLSGLQNEEMVNTMHILLVYLQSSPPEQRPLVAVLLLHFELLDDEEEGREQWLGNLLPSLLGGGKNSFLQTICKCLSSGNLDLVRVCLFTVSWLSHALASLPDVEFQLSAFSALISRLKESLENGELLEHKVLASMCLLNFSKIPECRVLLMTIAEDIRFPLRSLYEVTWTAKQLYGIISGEDL
ncbi:putative E3 ubiquitin-protein ligase LIN isoform X2 [Cornus florida]|uniref:putative E3 ubiquitin-protein ligase LIN isoform X2 n=1 Tax=Cornus florida TaxID=4283 RepID=UPI00289959EE|nr:putative E3 ubiquitin-protein ligase LIN isoform X2 [Cornus florida]